ASISAAASCARAAGCKSRAKVQMPTRPRSMIVSSCSEAGAVAVRTAHGTAITLLATDPIARFARAGNPAGWVHQHDAPGFARTEQLRTLDGAVRLRLPCRAAARQQQH